MHRRRVAVVIGLVLGVVVLGIWWGRHRRPSVAPVAAPAPERGQNPAPAAGPRDVVERLPAAPPALPPAITAVVPPIIDEVTVEKPEVCEGEENLVTVRAHTPDGNDAYLHYQ